MNLDECFEKRLLRKGRPDRLKSEKALEMAARALTQAEKLFEHGFFEQTIHIHIQQCFREQEPCYSKTAFSRKAITALSNT